MEPQLPETESRTLTHLSSLDILHDAEQFIAAVTTEQINRAETKIAEVKSGEKPLGVIHNISARRLWVATGKLKAQSDLVKAQAGLADDDAEQAKLHSDHYKLLALAGVIRDLFWLQVRADIGYSYGEPSKTIGVRSGWMAVEASDGSGGPPPALLRLLGVESE